MTTRPKMEVLIWGTSLLLSAVADHLAQAPGVEVRFARTHCPDADDDPDVIVMERDPAAPDEVPAAALKLLSRAANRSILLLDPRRSSLVVLSAHAMLVESMTEVVACVEQACRLLG